MEDLFFKDCTISGLPLNLYDNTNLSFSRINYLFGPNGSGKSLTLRNIIAEAKKLIGNSDKKSKGYFAQYIGASLNRVDFHGGSFSIIEDAVQRDLSGDLTPESFYQHLSDHPEIEIKIRDSIQKYLGRHPQIVRRGVQNVMTFLREDDSDIGSYSPNEESDGLKRLSLLLTYVYHPKCQILAIDEPELHLHPDMISFLLAEIKEEIKYGKQFFFATHSPEMIEIADHETHAYFFFNLKDKIKESKILDLFQIGAQEIMTRLGFRLDVNRRAFLFAPITLFVEGIHDEFVFSSLKTRNLVEWPRRIFMANIGGATNARDFVELWQKMNKYFCLILDNVNGLTGDRHDAVQKAIDGLCDLFSITETDLEIKKEKLKEHNIFIAPYTDILDVVKDGAEVHVSIDNLQDAWEMFDLTAQIDTLKLALNIEKEIGVVIRNPEKEWLKNMIAEIASLFSNAENFDDKLREIKEILEDKYPGLEITIGPDGNSYLRGVYSVSKHRKLSFTYAKDSANHSFKASKE